MRLRIDPHVHSRLSDGTDSPRELLLRARTAGLDVIGAVDHDTLDHWSEFRAAHQELLAEAENPPAVILGAEISASLDGVPVHLLAYLPDPKRGNLRRQLANAKSDRVERLQKMVEKIAVDYPITWQDVLDEVAGLMPGRPHLGDALVHKGYFTDRSEAFKQVLGTHSPYYVRRPPVDAITTIQVIIADGGVPVLAHPFITSRGKAMTSATVRALAMAGLAGIETAHREMEAAARDTATVLAAELGLFVTGSSDYHGTGKPNQLGENLTSETSLRRIIAAGATEILGQLPH